MRIAAQSTIGVCERALLALNETNAEERLRLPTNFRHLAGGAEAALTQLIITWAQRRAQPTLELFAATESQLNDFVRRLPGLVAGLCATEAISVGTAEPVIRPLKSAALTRLTHLQGPRPQLGYRGSSVEIVCADHLGRDAPYLLYLPGNGLRPRSNFSALARWLLEKAIPGEYRRQFDTDAAEAIGALLFELFLNTQDHARVDVFGNLLDISVRALKTNHHALRPDQLAAMVEDFHPLAAYCTTLQPPTGAAYAHFFELSVLDSGPGFAVTHERLPLEQISLEDEECAVRECFGDASSKGESRFGMGLPLVLNVLRRQRGFLRLRTGRLSFYADFSDPATPVNTEVLKRYDPFGVAGLAPVSGSLLTILIPMRR